MRSSNLVNQDFFFNYHIFFIAKLVLQNLMDFLLSSSEFLPHFPLPLKFKDLAETLPLLASLP